MSYDLMVFDADVAPRDRPKFLAWYQAQSEWRESHGYGNPEVPAPCLQRWFREAIKTFPPMNGPLASDDPDDPRVTDYSLGRSVIYGAFSWSEAESAYALVKELAAKHGVGFFDASGEGGDIWWPANGWRLSCEARGEIPMPPDLSFAEALTTLDPETNSFFVLEHENGNYMQCGGGKGACTVECRVHESPTTYVHHVVGYAGGSAAEASVPMSGGVLSVQKGEVLNAADSAELFAHFVAGKPFPDKYALRQKDM